jgi:polar amino acid transport system substrate-binding protein
MAIKNGEPALAAFLSTAGADWAKSGYILSLETKYGIPHSAYAVQQHDKYES